MSQVERRAAQYVRMSTDMQRYSIENQSDAIGLYAIAHGYSIVRSYEDIGRSGLHFDSRRALRRLMDDVQSRRVDFETVLVYDVSRWGRFQDTDEAAFYEFLCKNAGVAVVYCAEEFENDGSLLSAVIKNIKRAMAGEFSRDLSKRVFAGQKRIASLGYHIGSDPGYGLRRMLVDAMGARKHLLHATQRKSIASDRVILVPGPTEEVRVVRRVYSLFLDQNQTMKDIAFTLNREGILNARSRDWSNLSVSELLSNEKYMGNSVYGRTSKKLGRNWQKLPSSDWTRFVGAYEPIISPERFAEAAKRLDAIHRRVFYLDNYLLDALSAYWCRKGKLSSALLKQDSGIPAENTYKRRFGSVANAFQQIGYRLTPRTGENLRVRKAICQTIAEGVIRHGGAIEPLPGSCSFIINKELKVSVVVGRSKTAGTANEWQFGYRSQRRPDLLIVVRLTRERRILDYYILPFAFLARGTWITLSGRNYQRIECYRSDSLDPLFRLCSRLQLRWGA